MNIRTFVAILSRNPQYDFPKMRGGGQRPFGTFPKIHPFSSGEASLIMLLHVCIQHHDRLQIFRHRKAWIMVTLVFSKLQAHNYTIFTFHVRAEFHFDFCIHRHFQSRNRDGSCDPVFEATRPRWHPCVHFCRDQKCHQGPRQGHHQQGLQVFSATNLILKK